MRPSQNKRMRGRNNNRKGPNPLSRTYESNGPDVKIRGTAHHIGEKYLQLARDAQSGGDPVMAESYLQHAEHYFRLIAAAQQAQQAAYGFQRQGNEAEAEDLEEEDDFSAIPDRFASPIERVQPPAQQPYVAQPQPQPQPLPIPERERPMYGNGERQPYERQDRGNRQDRNPERGERGNSERGNGERPYQDKRGGRDSRDAEGRGQRGRGGRDFRPDYRQDYRPEARIDRGENRAPSDELESPGLPAFITAPVRLQQEAHEGGARDESVAGEYIERSNAEGEAVGFHLRPRRRRRAKADMGIGESAGEAAAATDTIGD
jgi:Domain of unknown function (DUF4167)